MLEHGLLGEQQRAVRPAEPVEEPSRSTGDCSAVAGRLRGRIVGPQKCLPQPQVCLSEVRVRGDGATEVAGCARQIPCANFSLAERVGPQGSEGTRLFGAGAPGRPGARAQQRIGQRVEGRPDRAVRRHPRRDFAQRRAAARRVVHARGQPERIAETPQLPHHQPSRAKPAGDGERGVERDPERSPRTATRQRVVDTRLVGEPDFNPARKALGQQLRAVGAVERALLAALAMREGKDCVAGRVEGHSPSAGGRGPVGALPGCESGETDDQGEDDRDDRRARPHTPPAVNGSSAARISPARCHRSARDFASARATAAASFAGTSRRRLCKSGAGLC